MGPYPAVIDEELDRYLPFLATTEMLAVALNHGIGREKAHKIIKKHAINEALRMREEGSKENKLVCLLSEEPKFREAGITFMNLRRIFEDSSHFVGNAHRQIDSVIKNARPLLDRYPTDSRYEPGEIL
jgi:adenylosuccinate lyase